MRGSLRISGITSVVNSYYLPSAMKNKGSSGKEQRKRRGEEEKQGSKRKKKPYQREV